MGDPLVLKQLVTQPTVVFDLIIPRPGKYAFVNHDIRNVLLGSVGVLEVQ
jgi:hypothetical protein